ncbi:MAG: type II toxin-antitoxin system RelE/ParE family toxin [Stellaceae bacterium]
MVETPEFLRNAKKLLTDAKRGALIDWLAANPTAGDLMPGTGGARKLRWGVAGRGKRGGVRVITYYAGLSLPVFAMMVFGKNEKANLSTAERNELRTILAEIGRQYRQGAR